MGYCQGDLCPVCNASGDWRWSHECCGQAWLSGIGPIVSVRPDGSVHTPPAMDIGYYSYLQREMERKKRIKGSQIKRSSLSQFY